MQVIHLKEDYIKLGQAIKAAGLAEQACGRRSGEIPGRNNQNRNIECLGA